MMTIPQEKLICNEVITMTILKSQREIISILKRNSEL